MRTRWIVALLALLLIVPPTAATATQALAPASEDPPAPEALSAPAGFATGVNYHGVWDTLTDSARAEVLNALADAGTQWVRLDTSWDMFQPSGPNSYDMEWGVPLIDRRISEITQRGMKVDLLVYWAPEWASGTSSKAGRPRNPKDFANFAAWVANRYNGTTVSEDLKIDALELWNEPDLPEFWNQSPSETAVSSFAELIKAAGPAAKAANPALTVLAGGPSSVDIEWYQKFYATPGIIGSYDGLVVHPYQSPGDAAPEDFDPKYAQYFMSYLPALAQLMDQQNDPAKIWATEFGWTAYQAPAGSPPWALGVTKAQQAAYLLRGLAVIAQASPRLQAAFWYNAWDTQTNNPQQDNFGLLGPEFQRKPAWYAMLCANTGQCDYVASGSHWRFNYSGTELPADWKDQGYDDSSWKLSATPAGYGNGDEATVLPVSTVPSGRPISVYARTTFPAGNDPSNSASATLRMQVDDGAVVYLNGQEIVRYNMPTGDITPSTLASSSMIGAAELTWRTFDVPLDALQPGINQLAVEIHQATPSPTDMRFDLSLNSVAEVNDTTVPQAPTGVTAKAGDSSAEVSWTAPAEDGGSAITGYTVKASPGTAGCTTTGATSCTVAGLAPGTPYTFTVRASNAMGAGPASAASPAVTPVGVANAPSNVTATAGVGSAEVSWKAAASNGSPITAYTATASPGGATCTTDGATTCTIDGLTSGTPYTFTVTATNGVGTSPASEPSAPVVPLGPPGSPADVTAVAGNGSLAVTWTAPTSDGGSPITGYTATAEPGGAACQTTGATSCTIDGLTNGTAYTVSVVAANAVGPGPASAPSAPATPLGPPSAPTGVTAIPGDASVQVSWTAPDSDGGSPVTSYQVTASPSGATCSTTGSLACAITGLANGTSYTFDVAAVNAVGTGPAATSSPVTPQAAQPAALAVGSNYHGIWDTMTDANRAQVLDQLVDAGNQWVRLDVSWAMFQPNGPDSYDMAWGVPLIDSRISEITRRGMKVLLMVYWAPEWATGTTSKAGRPTDPQDFANLTAWVANRYNGASVSPDLRIDALELWNEPNEGAFWDQSPSDTAVSSFAELIKVAGPAAKAANPKLTVVTGGISSVDTDWYQQFYATPGIIGTYDAVGVHPYQSPSDAPPEAFDPKYAQYFMANMPALVKLMDDVGDPAKIWATEFGWTAYQAPAGSPPWLLGVTDAQQAAYLLRGYAEMAKSHPRLAAAFWYNTWDTQENNPQQDNYGLLDVPLTRKPAWYSFLCQNTGQCDYLPSGSTWSYNTSGLYPGSTWTSQSFDDSTWPTGATPIGYGNGNEKTTLQQRPITVYARTSFAAGSDPTNSDSATLRLQIDDGAIVYLNGEEVARFNMPAGDVTPSTLALKSITGAAELQWQEFEVPLTALAPGINQLAVEIHQSTATPNDMTFDASLSAVAKIVAGEVPSQPTGVTATAGTGSAKVSWSAPASDGGAEITDYIVTAAPGDQTCYTTGATSCTVNGLTAGTAYTFTVRAANLAGAGPASDPSPPVTVN